MADGTIALALVELGDFLTGIDNGYVVEREDDQYETSLTFHTADGEEATLTGPRKMPVAVRRPNAELPERNHLGEFDLPEPY